MIDKHLLRADRQRQIPASFSWVYHRLIRQAHLNCCDHSAWALYLFLVTVGDVQGLSYYSDAAIGRHLKMDPLQLAAARQQLTQADLIAYRKPLYQVLALPPLPTAGPRAARAQSVGDILRQVLAGVPAGRFGGAADRHAPLALRPPLTVKPLVTSRLLPFPGVVGCHFVRGCQPTGGGLQILRGGHHTAGLQRSATIRAGSEPGPSQKAPRERR